MAPPTRYPNTEARRQAVKEALATHGRLTMAQRRDLAERFACTAALIGYDITQLAPIADSYVPSPLSVDSLMGTSDAREIALLRALGRLEIMSSMQIKGLMFPDTTATPMRTRLHRLQEQGLIWQTTTSMPTLAPRETGTPRSYTPKAPYIYGLTHEGKAYLEAMDAEPHAATYERLKSRDRRAPTLPKQQLTHDLLASAWCCSVIDAARRCSLLVDIRCQVEYVSAYDERGKEMQRFDAYLALRFARSSRVQTQPGWWIPWYDGDPDTDQHVTVRFALEVDRGTEKLAILLAKAYMYRTLTASGHYKQTLGGPVTPVVLAPPGRRTAQIAREWQTGWPGGMGVISTPRNANHPIGGALWGQYLTLKDDPAKPARLLGNLVSSVESWTKLCEGWAPGVPTSASR